MDMSIKTTWRDDGGLVKCSIYKKRLAIWPTVCSDGKKVWLGIYYKKYNIWSYDRALLDTTEYGHTEFVETVSEEDYIVRKLAETL